MKNPLIYVLVVILIAIGCKSPEPKETKEPTSTQVQSDNLEEYFMALAKLQKFNGAILIQKDGKQVIRKAFNMTEDKNNSLHVTENSQFDVHSISKLMAKAAIVKMVKANQINREDKINKFIPDFPKGESISIQNLLDNQSGLPRNLSIKEENLIEKTPAEFVDLIKAERLLFEPGSETLYSNIGYQLVYYIISEIANKPFAQYLKDDLFTPMGMGASGAHFHADKSNLINAVRNHVEEDDEIITVPNYEKTSKNQARVYSTLDDLLQFIDEIKNEPYRSKLKNKSGNIGWSGGGEGILSHAEANLRSGYEVIFFSNYDEISFGGILGDIEKIMTNKPYNVPKEINRKAVAIDLEILQQYVGKYDMAEFNHDEFEFRIEKDSAAFYQNGEFGGMLKAENDTTFFGDPRDEDYFVFRKNKDLDYDLIFMYKGIDIVGIKK